MVNEDTGEGLYTDWQDGDECIIVTVTQKGSDPFTWESMTKYIGQRCIINSVFGRVNHRTCIGIKIPGCVILVFGISCLENLSLNARKNIELIEKL